jgi:1,4-alpha-glucan branching enzyme
MAPSDRSGMGAVPFDDGTSFRVWAPHATAVSVAGQFNGWSESADPLTDEGNGYWSAFVSAARPPHQYKFVLAGPFVKTPWKNDPYAREMTSSAGNSVIAEPDRADNPPEFRTPAWNELLIYELHVGTFTSDPAGPQGRGTFRSTIGKLDYIRGLGFNAIQLMASAEFPAMSRGATTRRTSSRSSRRTAVRMDSATSSTPRTRMASPSSWTSSTTIWLTAIS